jgi:hypothetical protein
MMGHAGRSRGAPSKKGRRNLLEEVLGLLPVLEAEGDLECGGVGEGNSASLLARQPTGFYALCSCERTRRALVSPHKDTTLCRIKTVPTRDKRAARPELEAQRHLCEVVERLLALRAHHHRPLKEVLGLCGACSFSTGYQCTKPWNMPRRGDEASH